ncbi:hypothetical protein SAMN04488025_12346 [Planifilum fulgidum]|uniref:Uncharacterized protein n=1 Tax=Planifilum fulgidum TaxID=201973 RepID=A0A1I2QKL3_9BACL|nr:hypothetical protein [Planifilum fulgidum]SFG26777.1 hypothetical protein SAMN04488025_12346 [Planifilum fulgidum]
MKKLLILGIVIVTLVAVYFMLYFIDVSGQILEVSGAKVTVDNMEEHYTEEDFIQQKGISPEQAKDIVKHPNQFRSVYLSFDLYNNSVWASVSNIQLEVHIPEDVKRRLVWIGDSLTFPYVGPMEEHSDIVIAYFKLEEGDTEEDLKEICKQIRFTLTGKKFGFFDHGSISVPVHFSGD